MGLQPLQWCQLKGQQRHMVDDRLLAVALIGIEAVVGIDLGIEIVGMIDRSELNRLVVDSFVVDFLVQLAQFAPSRSLGLELERLDVKANCFDSVEKHWLTHRNVECCANKCCDAEALAANIQWC